MIAGTAIIAITMLRKTTWLLPVAFYSLTAGQQTTGTATPDGQFKFETKVNAVLVPVLVRDSRGNAVGTLTKEDFRLFDRGKLQTISAFTLQTHAGKSTATKPGAIAATGRSAINGTVSEKSAPQRFVLFLFDDLHLNNDDLMRVRPAAAAALGGSLEDTDAAAVLSISGRTNTGFTRDRAKLQDAVMKLQRNMNYAHTPGCPNIDHYQAYMIRDLNDPKRT